MITDPKERNYEELYLEGKVELRTIPSHESTWEIRYCRLDPKTLRWKTVDLGAAKNVRKIPEHVEGHPHETVFYRLALRGL